MNFKTHSFMNLSGIRKVFLIDNICKINVPLAGPNGHFGFTSIFLDVDNLKAEPLPADKFQTKRVVNFWHKNFKTKFPFDYSNIRCHHHIFGDQTIDDNILCNIGGPSANLATLLVVAAASLDNNLSFLGKLNASHEIWATGMIDAGKIVPVNAIKSKVELFLTRESEFKIFFAPHGNHTEIEILRMEFDFIELELQELRYVNFMKNKTIIVWIGEEELDLLMKVVGLRKKKIRKIMKIILFSIFVLIVLNLAYREFQFAVLKKENLFLHKKIEDHRTSIEMQNDLLNKCMERRR